MTDINVRPEFEEYMGKEVLVKMDRPLGTKHPKFDWVYELNYGFIPDTKADDGEEIDVYIIGVDEPLKEFTGIVIGIVHRTDDNEDKLIVAPKGKTYTKEELTKAVAFQEKWFKSEVYMG